MICWGFLLSAWSSKILQYLYPVSALLNNSELRFLNIFYHGGKTYRKLISHMLTDTTNRYEVGLQSVLKNIKNLTYTIPIYIII